MPVVLMAVAMLVACTAAVPSTTPASPDLTPTGLATASPTASGSPRATGSTHPTPTESAAPSPTASAQPTPTSSPSPTSIVDRFPVATVTGPDLSTVPWAAEVGPESNSLIVGTLAGDERTVLTERKEIDLSKAPVDGRILASYDPNPGDGAARDIDLVDLVTGQSRHLLENATDVEDVALAPDGHHWYEVRTDATGIAGVWRLPLGSGAPEQVIDGWACTAGYGGHCSAMIVTSLDGRYVAVGTGPRLTRVLDTVDGTVSVISPRPLWDLFGFVGDELFGMGNEPFDDTGMYIRLVAVDVTTGDVRRLPDRGIHDQILAAADGSARLVRDGTTDDGYAAIWISAAGDPTEHELLATTIPWATDWLGGYNTELGLAAANRANALDTSGWVALLDVHDPDDRVALAFGGILVNLDDGSVAAVPPVQPTN